MGDKEVYSNYLKQLLNKLGSTLFIVIGIGVFYTVTMTFIDHRLFPFTYIVLFLSMIKTGIISYITLGKVSKLMSTCHSLNNMIWTFGVLILITLFSFSTDYTCLFLTDSTSFSGIAHTSGSYLYNLYQFFYFSVITFSTVGYGDISPVSDISKFIVMLEIFLSFLIIVFSITNIKKIHINE
jgi:hypothetical protein